MSHPNNKTSLSSVDNQEIELIVGNSSANFSGVTSTMLQVTSLQKHMIKVFLGASTALLKGRLRCSVVVLWLLKALLKEAF